VRPADRVSSELRARGLLLQQDKTLPSVVGLITGESLRTSWWSHPKGRAIFAVLSELADRRDVLFTKLLYGKSTLVHRRLWPALLAVGSARDRWQLDRLSAGARRVLRAVDQDEGRVRATGTVARELESRLLVVARQVHTEEGRHELALQSWRSWAAVVKCRRVRSVPAAKKAIELAASRLGAAADGLPWKAGGRGA
jgi:hypothetical protein